MKIGAPEKLALENIAKRDDIRFVRVSRALLEQGDLVGAVIVRVGASADSEWEAEIILRDPEASA